MEPVVVASIEGPRRGAAPLRVVTDTGTDALRAGGPANRRRSPAPPVPSPGEVVRAALVEQLARRFGVPLTVVVAGAGFGKSTALAQAIRANLADPRGVDAWVACEAGDGDAHRLAGAMIDALGGVCSVTRDPLDGVLEALGGPAPVDLCVVVDDVHEIPPDSPGAELLARLVRNLPPHAHLVLAGRVAPPVPLARLRAAGQVVDVGEHQLAFTDAEVAALAGRAGDDPSRLAPFAGWPALVRLALSAPGAAPQFLWEEVVSALGDRGDELMALATLGWGSAADVARVLGRGPVDLDRLAARIPLVERQDDGRYGVHRLWEDAAERVFPPGALATVRRRALALFEQRGETLRMGWSALRWDDAGALRVAARLLVRDTFGSLPLDTARRWLAEAPEPARGTPDLRLLELAARHAVDHEDPGLDAELDAVATEYGAGGDDVSAGVALALAAVVAHARGDELRLFAIDERARALGATGEPILQFLADAMVAGIAALQGDVDTAAVAASRLRYDSVPPAVTELVVRLHVTVLCAAGRAGEAVEVAARLAEAPAEWVRGHRDYARWHAGSPGPFLTAPLRVRPADDANERYHFYDAVFRTHVAAALGDRAAADALRTTIERTRAHTPDSRDRALLAGATAARQVAGRDEGAAARTIASFVDEHPGTDRLADTHLRRMPVVPYVCDERLRARWRSAELGPSHARQLDVADDLLAARAGTLARDAPLAPAAVVLTAMPLAWSVELAARAVANGVIAGTALASGLADLLPCAVREELRHLTGAEDVALAGGAVQLLSMLPDPHRPAIEVRLLGPLEVLIGGIPVAGDDIGRRRVRTLLALLAVSGPIRRERIADLMWPELGPAAASRNLRVTLTRLRSALGERTALRADADLIGLAPEVQVDLSRFRDDLAAAEAAERAGDAEAVVAALDRACARWRGDVLADLDCVPDLVGDVEHVRWLMVDAALRLGELHFVAGRSEEAVRWAERVRVASPYDERSHRLAVAAHLQRGDRLAAARAVAATRTMLAELAADPEPATEMLLRQAELRAGSLGLTAARSGWAGAASAPGRSPA